MIALNSVIKKYPFGSKACYSSSETTYLPFFQGIHHIHLQFLIYKFPKDLFSIMSTNPINTILDKFHCICLTIQKNTLKCHPAYTAEFQPNWLANLTFVKPTKMSYYHRTIDKRPKDEN